MYRNLLLALILLHTLGDFYFQTNALAERKDKSYRPVALHGLIYAAVLIVGLLPVFSFNVFIVAAILSALHFTIDSIKYAFVQRQRRVTEPVVYSVDQCLHLLLIVGTAGVFQLNGFRVDLFPAAGRMLTALNMNGTAVLGWACIIAVIGKPTNITIKRLLLAYRPAIDENAGAATNRNAGAFIGTLERIIIAMLLSVNQYAAIGLVLTAKSVARFDKISKDQAFAEYYLLGTLLSTLAVILAYMAFH